MNVPIRVVLVDDHQLFSQGLASLIEQHEDLTVVHRFVHPQHFLQALPALDVDVVLMDINLPAMSGLDAVVQALEIKPKLRIVMLSMVLNFPTVKEAMQVNAAGYLLKTAEGDEVVQAVRTVAQGQDYFTEEAKKVLLQSFRSDHTVGEIHLTPREKEILCLICEGLTTPQIAQKLNIAKTTVETHRGNVMSKTGCANSASLVSFAIKHGFC